MDNSTVLMIIGGIGILLASIVLIVVLTKKYPSFPAIPAFPSFSKITEFVGGLPPIREGDRVSWSAILRPTSPTEYVNVCVYTDPAPIQFTGHVMKITTSADGVKRANVRWDAISIGTVCKTTATGNQYVSTSKSPVRFVRQGDTLNANPTWESTYLGTATAAPTYFAKLFSSPDGSVPLSELKHLPDTGAIQG